MSKTSHYKATTKRGFEAGELASLLASHSPNADYKVVISLRGKVRELIVTEDGSAGVECAAAPETQGVGYDPVTRGPVRRKVDDQRHGGKLQATFHPELTDEALNARFGDPLKGNLDRLHSGERPPGGRTRFADRAHFREEPPFLGKLTAEELFRTEDD